MLQNFKLFGGLTKAMMCW